MPVPINESGHTPSVRRAIERLAKDVDKPVPGPATGGPVPDEDGTPRMRPESRATCDEDGQPVPGCRPRALPEDDELGRPIWKQMGEARRRAGNGVPHRKGQKVRSHVRFIISPDPRDKVTIDTLRDLARSWAGHHFPDFESVIAYHDDGAGGVMHAHVIVNNTNVETGARLSSLLTDGFQKLMLNNLSSLSENVTPPSLRRHTACPRGCAAGLCGPGRRRDVT